MTTAAWLMLGTTWLVVLGFSLRFLIMAARRPLSRDSVDPED